MSDAPARPFKWVGGRLCLDFVNTVGGRLRGPGETYVIRGERLTSLADLAAWNHGSGLDGERSNRGGRRNPGALPRRAWALREALYRLFHAATLRRPADATDLALLSRELRLARHGERLAARRGGGFELRREAPASLAADVLARVAESAVELLTGPGLGRVRACPGEGCGWLFLDESRNGRRRWCDMKDCGNVDKVRRFRQRERGRLSG